MPRASPPDQRPGAAFHNLVRLVIDQLAISPQCGFASDHFGNQMTVEDEIKKIKALTNRPFGVNFLMDAPGAELISDAIIRQGVRAAGYNRRSSGYGYR